jgi:hypothetical protein
MSAAPATRAFDVQTVVAGLGTLAGVMSIVKLGTHAYQVGLVPVLQLLVDYYEAFAHLLASDFEAPIRDAVRALGLDVPLYPHWKHVFVLTGLYASRDAASTLALGWRGLGLLFLIYGLVVSLIASTAAGMLPLSQSDYEANFLIAALPLAGILIYEIGSDAAMATWRRAHEAGLVRAPTPSWWGYFGPKLLDSMLLASIGVIVLVAGLAMLIPLRLSLSPGLVMLGVLVVLFAIWLLVVGLRQGAIMRDENETLAMVLRRQGSWRVGRAMVITLTGAFVFVLLNAGLRLVRDL